MIRTEAQQRARDRRIARRAARRSPAVQVLADVVEQLTGTRPGWADLLPEARRLKVDRSLIGQASADLLEAGPPSGLTTHRINEFIKAMYPADVVRDWVYRPPQWFEPARRAGKTETAPDHLLVERQDLVWSVRAATWEQTGPVDISHTNNSRTK